MEVIIMSLLLWCPFNGNPKNQGTSDIELTEVAAPTYVNGKVSPKAISSGSYKLTAVNAAKLLNNEAVSICFWVYINAATGTSASTRLFGNGDITTGNNRKYALFLYPTVNDFHYSWMNNDTSNTVAAKVLGGVLPSYKWTHVAVTHEGSTAKIYINGKLADTFSYAASNQYNYETQLFESSSLRYLNDYRIYDHALSAREVNEVARGLTIHYQLNSQFESGQVNKYSGEYAAGKMDGVFTRTKLENERGYNYKYSCTGNGNNNWPYMTLPNFSFTAGKKYFYSMKVRVHSANFDFYLRAARSNNDWVTNAANIFAKKDGKWHECYAYQTIQSTYDRSGSTVTCNPVLECYAENLYVNGRVYSADFDIKDCQVIESNEYVPFIENSMRNAYLTDVSGFSHYLPVSGAFQRSGDSPRGFGSYYVPSSSVYAGPGSCPLAGTSSIYSISFWAKRPYSSTDNGMPFGFADGNRLNLYFYQGKLYWNTGDSQDNPFQSGGTAVSYPTDNQWHHYVITANGSTNTLYIDGEVKGTARIFRSITGTMLTISGWNGSQDYKWSNGYLSDFRIYATCLSADIVKELYNSPIVMDKEGNVFAVGYEEVF